MNKRLKTLLAVLAIVAVSSAGYLAYNSKINDTEASTKPVVQAPKAAPYITLVSPSAQKHGADFFITGTGFTKKNNVFFDGIQYHDFPNRDASPAGKNQTEIHIKPAICPNQSPKNQDMKHCPSNVINGTHSVYITNENGQSNQITITTPIKTSQSF